MPKFLYLMRHAQSEEKQSQQHDKDRELTPLGVKEALRISALLNQRNIRPDMLYTSTATRSAATAQLISDAIRLDIEKVLKEDELYNASVRTFLEFLNNIEDQHSHILCIGHNPVVSYLAEYLTKAEIGDMPPAGIVFIKFNSTWRELGEGTAILSEYTTPQQLQND
jgi:phosphohistidine phosphatase